MLHEMISIRSYGCYGSVVLSFWTLNPVFLQLHPRVERENSENQEALGGGQDTQEEAYGKWLKGADTVGQEKRRKLWGD